MKRLTKRSEDGVHAYFPECFNRPCDGIGCDEKKLKTCDLMDRVCAKLATYEDAEGQGLLAWLPCKERESIYRCAIDTYGPESQTLMVFEEMAELQKELCKHARGADNREAIAEEIADVLVMLEQMMFLHDCHELVQLKKAEKTDRLAMQLEMAGHGH